MVKLANFLDTSNDTLTLKMRNGEDYVQYAAARYEQVIALLQAIKNASSSKDNAYNTMMAVIHAFVGREPPAMRAFVRVLADYGDKATLDQFDDELIKVSLMDEDKAHNSSATEMKASKDQDWVEGKLNGPGRLSLITGILYDENGNAKGLDIIAPYFAQVTFHRFPA